MSTTVEQTISKGKKSLDEVLRKKAYEDIAKHLNEQGIDIKEISESDLEELVAAKVSDMNNNLKGFAAGGAFVVLLESLF